MMLALQDVKDDVQHLCHQICHQQRQNHDCALQDVRMFFDIFATNNDSTMSLLCRMQG